MSMSVTPVELVLYVEFVAAVHDHHGARRENLRCIVGADHARQTELARHDRRVRRHAPGVGYDRRRASHDRHPVRRRHPGHEDFARQDAGFVLR